MKKLTAPLLLFVLTLLAFSSRQDEISKKDRNKAIAYFNETRDFLKKEIAGLSESQLNWTPADSVWSIAQCVEHIAITETGIFEWAMSTLKAPTDSSIDASKKITDEEIKKTVTDRSHRAKAPEVFKPSGQFGNTAHAFSVFSAKRDSLIQYMKTTKDDLRGHLSMGPFGVADTYQILLLLSGHTKRHTLQIAALKAIPGFPQK